MSVSSALGMGKTAINKGFICTGNEKDPAISEFLNTGVHVLEYLVYFIVQETWVRLGT